MFGSVLIDVTIGVILLYLLVALFCTAIQEWIAQLFDFRAKQLQQTISLLIGGSGTPNPLAAQVLAHPLVRMLGIPPGERRGPKDPAYVTAANFSDALVQKLLPAGQALDINALTTAVNGLANNPALKEPLSAIIQRATGLTGDSKEQLRAAMTGIEKWYDSAMGHATGWYKRSIRGWLLGIAAVLTVVLNADSMQVAMLLSSDAQLRERVAAYAAQVAPAGSDAEKQLIALRADLDKRIGDRDFTGGFGSLPIGWEICRIQMPTKAGEVNRLVDFTRCYPSNRHWMVAFWFKVLGLTLTALAAALGAPFWFGLLQQLNAIRSAGPRPGAAASE